LQRERKVLELLNRVLADALHRDARELENLPVMHIAARIKGRLSKVPLQMVLMLMPMQRSFKP
jgi:hypothetical protein